MSDNFKTNLPHILILIILLTAFGCNDNKSNSTYSSETEYNSGEVNYLEEENEEFDLGKHLMRNSFSINGNGNVSFNIMSSGNGTIIINGNGNTLQGNVVITSNSSIRISGLMAVGGNYDASNNGAVSGSFHLDSIGNLEGSLTGNRGNSKEVIFKLKL